MSQLRGFTDRARTVAGSVPARLSLPALPSPPGAHVGRPAERHRPDGRAQRQSITAIRAQLDAFDEQLGVFERILGRSSSGAPPGRGWRRPSATWCAATRPRAGPRAARPRPDAAQAWVSLGLVAVVVAGAAAQQPGDRTDARLGLPERGDRGMRSSWMRRRVSGTVSTAGSSSTRPTRSRPGLRARTGSSAPRPGPRGVGDALRRLDGLAGQRRGRGELPDVPWRSLRVWAAGPAPRSASAAG